MLSISEILCRADEVDRGQILRSANSMKRVIVKGMSKSGEMLVGSHRITHGDVKLVLEALVHCCFTEQDREY